MVPISFFVQGDPVQVFGQTITLHLFGLENTTQRFYVFGADGLGRDMFARTLKGGQISTTVGLFGVALSIIFGTVLGTASGYWGGWIDDVMQRIIEVLGAFPTVPLWAALAAAMPPISEDFTVVHRYFLITVVLSIVSWTGLARQLRAKVMSYRGADFTPGSPGSRRDGLAHHLLPHDPQRRQPHHRHRRPSIPGMILGETALSFLGLGILPPAVSWGSLLREAQQVSVVVESPLAAHPGCGGNYYGAVVQLDWRRSARCRRSLLDLTRKAG